MNNKLTIPESLYGNSAFQKYNAVKIYEENILDSRFYTYIFDSWKLPNYGLIDNAGNALFPKNGALRSYANNNGIVQTNISFVADAFADLKKYYLEINKVNKLNKSSPIYADINAFSTYKKVDNDYVPHVQKIYDVFKTTRLGESQVQKIDNVDAFMREFVSFITVSSRSLPLNRSSYIESRWSNLELSGLVINLASPENLDNLKIKIDKYINDPNFTTFIDSARRYGFFVDKSAPWRIVADLGSPVMASYYKKYGLGSVDDVFGKWYFKAHESDLETLKNVLLSFWNTYAESNKLNINAEFAGSCGDIYTSVSINKPMNMAKFLAIFNDSWFMRLYIYTKVYETGIEISQKKFEALYLEAVKLQKYAGTAESTAYINKQLLMLNKQKSLQKTHLTDIEELVKLLQEQVAKQPAQGLIF